jgi:hypothetical protein
LVRFRVLRKRGVSIARGTSMIAAAVVKKS